MKIVFSDWPTGILTMKNNQFFYLSVICALMASCVQTLNHDQNLQVRVTGNEIIIPIAQQGKDPELLRVQIITNDIIRVTATSSDSFATEKSLMTVSIKDEVNWSHLETDTAVVVSTDSIHVYVLRNSGAITFTDVRGNVLLKEEPAGGKTFTRTTVEGKPYYSVRQTFLSPDDEAFYGLGAHQNGQMNYKNDDVDLVQANIADVVPFVYSNRNYGILWDNCSSSKFGDPREYEPLGSIGLFDKSGHAGGLSSTYYIHNRVVKDSVESVINYEFLETPQVDNFPKAIAHNGKVVWEGSLESEKAGDHKFLVYSSGYCKLWIDDSLIIDKWRQNWNPWTNKFKVNFKSGQRHNVKIEWIPEGGYLSVKHLDPLEVDEQNKLSLWSEVADQIDYYFIKGNNADGVIKGYRQLTGKAPIVPKWALGFWQSRERYKTQDELINVVKEYRKRKIPLDNIVLDWQYWEDPKWGSHEFDAKRFPEPKKLIDVLHNELHAHLMISVWPKFNKGTTHYEEMDNKGYLFKRNIEKKRKDWVGPGYESTFYDPFNPDAGALFWKQIDSKLNSLGIDAWWLDATEPDIHSNISVEERKLNMSPTAIGAGAKYFNAFSLVNSKSVYEGQRASSPDKRVFILTRSAFGGQQRYGAATWSGDIVSRWSDLKDQLSAGINFSLSGIPYWTMDIGGFAVEKRYENATGETLREWRELNTRWFQFGAFCPIFRSHGQFPYREIFNIAPEGSKPYESMVYYTKLRYKLLPYIYSLAGSAYLNDYTIMRGLVMDFPEDKNVTTIADQYMFGPSLMVCPIYTDNAKSRNVYLPHGASWYDFNTFKKYEGGRSVSASAPLERLPLFIKSGTILPIGPDLQYTSQKSDGSISLYIFPGQDGTFTLYEDEGVNYDYERGQFSTVEIKYNDATHTVTIGKRRGEFAGMLRSRTIRIFWVKDSHDGELSQPQPDRTVEYAGEELIVTH